MFVFPSPLPAAALRARHAPLYGSLLVLGAALLTPVPAAAQARPLVDLRPATPRALQLGGFELAAPAEVRIEATGAPREVFQELSRGLLARLARGLNIEIDADDGAWAANAWVLDARTRQVVWDLSRSSGRRLRNGLRSHAGSLRLPAGAYEVYYATSLPMVNYRNGRAEWPVDDDVVGQLGIKLRGPGRPLAGSALQQVRNAANTTLALALSGAQEQARPRAGFELTQPTVIEVVMAGEADRGDAFDHGWIINADTRQKVWSFDYERSRPAGGARKNRIVRERVTLPAGRYAAVYVTDDSHGPAQWNSAPPYDPQTWGLYLHVPDAGARGRMRQFEYEVLPKAQVVTSLTRVGDDEAKRGGFTLTRAADVRVFALGEGDDDDMDDYAWIMNADTRQVAWQMRYDQTEHGGGARKNRLFDGIVRLPAGNYELHYVTDGSHAYGDWNSDAPEEPEQWGVTILAARPGDRSAFREYDPGRDAAILAQLVGIRDDQRARKSFRMERDGTVHVYALGEGDEDEMYDYAWIEEAGTKRVVWELTYRMTSHAGGASKNRVFDGNIQLPAGEYLLHYRSDSSHSYGSWNSDAPRDPSMWGVTLRKK